jgi:hypothetical protein
VFGEPFIEERVVRSNQREHAAVVAQHAVEEQLGFFTEGLSKVIVKVPENSGAGSQSINVAKPQPLTGEVRREVERAAIGEHSTDLLLKLRGLAEFAANRSVEQFIVGNAAP